jgi:hypothetical protein
MPCLVALCNPCAVVSFAVLLPIPANPLPLPLPSPPPLPNPSSPPTPCPCPSPPPGCLGLALLRSLSLAASGSPTAEASCQTNTAGQLDGLSRKLLLLEDSYLGKVRERAGMWFKRRSSMATHAGICKQNGRHAALTGGVCLCG